LPVKIITAAKVAEDFGVRINDIAFPVLDGKYPRERLRRTVK
jgi:hypothetical protein